MPGSIDATGMRFGSGLSVRADPWDAAEACAAEAIETLAGRRPDFAVAFISGQHAGRVEGIADVLRSRLDPACLIGCTASGVVGGAREIEGEAAVSVFAASMPGVTVSAFTSDGWPASRGTRREPTPETDAALLGGFGFDAGAPAVHRGSIVLADPFSVPISTTLARVGAAIDRAEARTGRVPGPIVGGLASRGSAAGQNTLLLNDTVRAQGAVGLALSGAVRLDTVVSQGCRPVGPPYVVTRAKGHLVFDLGGRPALDRVREALGDLPDEDRKMLDGGLLLGRAVSEYRDRFGRGDFLIRQVVGADRDRGFLAVGDEMPAGRTVRFHIRDRATADEDLGLLLDGQQVHGRPAGGLLFTCTGRGKELFGESGHDARAIQRAFRDATPGPDAAKAGVEVEAGAGGSVPISGMFAAGEIGPLGARPYLHGHTASLALFREVERASADGGLG
jgi:small ligand-binding sensory domain FIST